MSLFSCPSCLRRTIHNLSLEHINASSSSLFPPAHTTSCKPSRNRLTGHISRRTHATYESLVTGHHRRALRLTLSKKTPPPPNRRRKGAGSHTKGEIKDALARHSNRTSLDALSGSKDGGNGAADTALSPAERRERALLKREVEQYYSDPLQLANAVTSKLRVPDFQSAIALVRASEGIVTKNVVSWNHCIDWCMSQGDTDKAWKLYNELKKRGHRPDAHTYTIMLRGLSQNSRKPGAAQRAENIYNSMFAPNSAVVPNTIHTNAVLNVCARARDMESLWAIAGRLPERGPGAPDRWTFTTILNAIKEDATAKVAELLRGPRGESGEEDLGLEERQKIIFDEALRDGRKLWADVSFRWRRADLIVDEQLVCAMGRLILGCGTQKDFAEVFDLVDSTMNIRLAERGHKKGASPEAEESKENEEVTDEEAVPASSDKELALMGSAQSSLPLGEQQVYATPGNNTLSLLIEAATGAREHKLGRAYWHVLTTPNGPFKVAPDADNIISYLRLLRISRASKDALDILSREWPTEVAEKLYRRGTFVIAMSTCIRDKNNPNVFNTASKLLNLMQSKLEEAKVGMYDKVAATESDPNLTYKERKAAAKARVANIDEVTFGEDEGLAEMQRNKSGVESSVVDPKALRMYVDLAILRTSGWNEGVRGKEGYAETFERDPMKNNALRALRRIGPDMINMSRLVRMKLLEAEVSSRSMSDDKRQNLSRNAQRKISDRAGTRVAEKLEDMVDLLRAIVGAYDKVISINERFEDTDRPTLEKRLVEDYQDQKRKINAFLTRTKDEVQKITRGSLNYAKWKTASKEEFDEDEEDDDDGAEKTGLRSSSHRRAEIPKIGREVRRIYEDTDRDIGRLQQRSRRQKLERQQGVDRRMKSRLGMGHEQGVLDEDLNITERKEVEDRMRTRAFNIRIGGTGRKGDERSPRRSGTRNPVSRNPRSDHSFELEQHRVGVTA